MEAETPRRGRPRRFSFGEGTGIAPIAILKKMKREQPPAIASCSSSESGQHTLLTRVPVIIGAILVLDWILLATLVNCYGWELPLGETVIMGVVGLLVIVYYEWRWSEPVAMRLQSEPGLLDRWSFERILLLIAGLVMLIPGVVTDFLGVLLLMPGIRRTIVHLVNLRL
jgi:UPF0716 family protein affecting phage T7 exclusion